MGGANSLNQEKRVFFQAYVMKFLKKGKNFACIISVFEL